MTQPAPRRPDPMLAGHDHSEMNRALSYTTSLDEVAHITVERVATLVGASAALLLTNDGANTLRLRASAGMSAEAMTRLDQLSGDEITENFATLFGVPDEAFIAVPLVAGGAVIGLLAVGLTHATNEADEWMLAALADQAAPALESARLGGEVRVEMEGRLRASEASTSAKDRALATLAHDIRSPLGAIDGYCSNLDDGLYGPLTPAQQVAIGRVRMSGHHLLSLLDSVMEMARLGAGVVALKSNPVSLAEIARDAVDILRPSAAAKGQRLELEELGDDVVLADATRIRQVLVNLIGNAVKFTPAGGTVTVRSITSQVGSVRSAGLVVTDTGPGIPESEQTAIFEAYYRAPNAAMTPGVGLGLAISYALVKRMDGDLTVRSTPGKGASFAVTWPVHVPTVPTKGDSTRSSSLRG